MNGQSYYVQERGRISGPFDLDQLREMRRRNRLARFHMVSPDGKTWVEAETLQELFLPEPGLVADAPPPQLPGPPQKPGPSPPAAGSPGALWYYAVGNTVHGPVTTRFLQNLIDQGSAGPDLQVRPQRAAQWARCDEVGAFRFPAHNLAQSSVVPAEVVSRSRLLTAHPWVASSIVAVPVAAILVSGSIAVLAPWHRVSDRRGAGLQEGTVVAGLQGQPLPAPGPARPPSPPAGPPSPTEKKPTPVKPPPPTPVPPPKRPQVAEVRSGNVELPPASANLSQHDSASRALEVALPPGSGYRLRLRGLSDPETQKYRLSTRPLQPGRTDTLAVIQPPPAVTDKRARPVEAQELARFWIEDGRLLFRWAPKLTRDMIEPARALRDCVLEVEAVSSRLKLALREMIKDSDSLSVSKDKAGRVVTWKRYPPIRSLRITSCKVRFKGESREARLNADRDECRLKLEPEAKGNQRGSSSESSFDLTVIWNPAKSALTAKLNPTLNALSRDRKQLRNQLRDSKDRMQGLEQQVAATVQAIKEYTAGANVQIKRQGQQPETLTDFADRLLAQMQNSNRPAAELHFDKCGDAYLDGLFQQIVNAQKQHEVLKIRYTQEEDRLRSLGKMIDEFTELADAPIVLRLGMLVESELMEIAAFGRE
jgi:hypothetical protein